MAISTTSSLIFREVKLPVEKPDISPTAGQENVAARLRPTVINPPLKKKAPAVDGVVASDDRQRSTVGEKRQGTRPDNDRPTSTPKVSKPTALPGVERKRIDVEAADIKKLAPLASADVARRAVRLLETFVAEAVTDRSAVLWGHQLQQQYSELVSRTLELSQDDLLVKATGYINRMVAILASIDIQAAADAAPGTGGLGQYIKRLNSRVDTADELEGARIELDQLVKLMGASLEPLLALKETLDRHSRRVDDVGLDIEAAALAAEYLSNRFAQGKQDLSRRFLERGMSLTQTVAQIRGSSALRAAQIEQPLGLIGAIQNVALVTVPGWLASLAALTASLRGRSRPTPTEAGEIAYQLRNILQQLKA